MYCILLLICFLNNWPTKKIESVLLITPTISNASNKENNVRFDLVLLMFYENPLDPGPCKMQGKLGISLWLEKKKFFLGP